MLYFKLFEIPFISMKMNIDYSIDMNMVTGIEDFLFQCKRLHFVA